MLSTLSSLPITGLIVAIVLNMLLGSFWYSSAGFGKKWMKLSGVDPKKMSSPALPMAFAILNSILLSVTITVLMKLIGITTISQAAVFVLWIWLAFSFVPMMMHVLFENREKGIVFINAFNELVSYSLITCAILWLS